VIRDAVLGQVVPPQPVVLEIRVKHGEVATTPIDDIGCFTSARSRRVRSGCAAPRPNAMVVTDWITL
jgi:hypothetical protein